MLPTSPPITRCPHCQAFFWIKEAPVIGEMNDPLPSDDSERQPPRIVPQAWRQVLSIRTPSAQEYLEAIATGAADTPERERTLRVLAWWRHNDAFRDRHQEDCGCRSSLPIWKGRRSTASSPPSWSLSPAAAENLERQIEILDSTDDRDRVKKAEALRERGQFDQAEALLLQPFPEGFQTAVEFILDLTRGRIHELRELPVSGGK
jgi:hypothetical protein